jgi:hypothetical protein
MRKNISTRQFGKHLKGFCKMVNAAFVFMIFLVLLSPGCNSIHHRGVPAELVEESFLKFDHDAMELLGNVGTAFPVEVSSDARLEVLEVVDVDSKETLRLFSATGTVLRAELSASSLCRKSGPLMPFWTNRVKKPLHEEEIGEVLEQPQEAGEWKSKKMLRVDELLPFLDCIRDAMDKHLDKCGVQRIFGEPNVVTRDKYESVWTYEIVGLPSDSSSYNLTVGFDKEGRLELWVLAARKCSIYSIDWFNFNRLGSGDPAEPL